VTNSVENAEKSIPEVVKSSAEMVKYLDFAISTSAN
jgi:hypothetical protein